MAANDESPSDRRRRIYRFTYLYCLCLTILVIAHIATPSIVRAPFSVTVSFPGFLRLVTGVACLIVIVDCLLTYRPKPAPDDVTRETWKMATFTLPLVLIVYLFRTVTISEEKITVSTPVFDQLAGREVVDLRTIERIELHNGKLHFIPVHDRFETTHLWAGTLVEPVLPDLKKVAAKHGIQVIGF